MCGEHVGSWAVSVRCAGSSPHVRGALDYPGPVNGIVGIIPACAGSTQRLIAIIVSPRDHPRMCGEHSHGTRQSFNVVGSSPHVRGALRRWNRRDAECGIIPACAGSTTKRREEHQAARDHPRMCGEHPTHGYHSFPSRGSSPHVRGAHQPGHVPRHQRRIIPACAGSTVVPGLLGCGVGDHPRMCGEHLVVVYLLCCLPGSSPHVRGALNIKIGELLTTRIIPACAGSTLCSLPCVFHCRDHPRMCGEHREPDGFPRTRVGSSPHVRGAQHFRTQVGHILGIIPACAGSTLFFSLSFLSCRDHPRMCGEHTSKIA